MDLFADNGNVAQDKGANVVASKPWVVLLIDDDIQVHQITKLTLTDFLFKGRKLKLLSAYSGKEAREIFKNRNDIALALVDVVMETDHAGLDLIKYVRSELHNTMTRLVLRTGQPGEAPEDQVIQEYEIDDYKEKTELTALKLRTLLYSMLRSYSDLCTIEEQKKGLNKVIEASATVQSTHTLATYATTALDQLNVLLGIDVSAMYCIIPQDIDSTDPRLLTLVVSGNHAAIHPFVSFSILPDKIAARCQEIIEHKKSQQYPDAHTFYSQNDEKLSSLLYLDLSSSLSDLERQFLDIYVQNITLTFENLNIALDIRETAKEIVINLANAVEARSKETGAHVERVALISERLATLYGLSAEESSLIKLGSPLHDIGKVAIPDRILHKPGKLDSEEWCEMQKHVEYGVQLLSKSKRTIICKGREIAASHHEKWDGTGYPNGLSGEDIPVSGRITAIADVFDALGSKRCYKEPWSYDDIKEELIAQRGKHFEPKLVDLMIEHWEEFVSIREMNQD